MPSFRYRAVDAQTGQSKQGTLLADSQRLARAELRNQGLLVTDLTEQKPEASSGRTGRRRWSSQRLTMMTRQGAALLEAGLTIEAMLLALFEQSETAGEKEVLSHIRSEVMAGMSWSQAMAAYPSIFSELYRTLVRAGEESGRLAEVLHRLADYLEQRDELRSKVGLALVYPVLLTVVASLVVLGLMTYVVPQVAKVFQTHQQVLPWLTRVVLGLSDGLRHGGWVVLLLLGPCVWLVLRVLKIESVASQTDRLLLRLPWLGRLVRGLNTARLASTLGILAGSGVPLLMALHAAQGVLSNRPLRLAVEQATRQVREGGSLAQALRASALFPPVLTHLVASGEATGRLEEMLERAAKQQTQELSARLSTFMSLIEPALILVMGAVVLLIVLAILMPIFDLNQMIR